ncbi:Cytochrome p450 86a2 [Globisporangium polare]
MIYTPWYMGRHNPVFGEDREVFRPERWLEMKTRPSAYDSPVFLAGPRICIGMSMAVIEVRLFVAVMVREFHIKIQEGEKVKGRGYILSPTLTMDGGLPLQMTPRRPVEAEWQQKL